MSDRDLLELVTEPTTSTVSGWLRPRVVVDHPGTAGRGSGFGIRLVTTDSAFMAAVVLVMS